MRRRIAILLLLLPPLALATKHRPWKDGQLLAVDVKDFMTGKHVNHIDHRYLCTVADGEYQYVVEYEKPLKVAVHDKLRFVVERDHLILLDADEKERSATIEKRERVAP